jgi:hypothetical protein
MTPSSQELESPGNPGRFSENNHRSQICGTAFALQIIKARKKVFAFFRALIAKKEEKTMLWTIIAILVVLWLLGFIGGVGGNLIHLLLVIAAVVLIFQLITGRRVAV